MHSVASFISILLNKCLYIFEKCGEKMCEICQGEQSMKNPNFVEMWVLPLWWLNKERPCQSGSSSSELAAYNNPKHYTKGVI